MSETKPFADSVVAYAQAGWPCILPVPPEKSPPPIGFTGADGRDTDPLQLVRWAETHAASSVALRMPDGVIGIDVDAYVKAGVTKHGERSFQAAIERWGPLPPTWTSTARGEGPSRIHFYRVPPGRYATKLDGGDVEIIQRHHRYAVVWPSPHKEAGTYTWYAPDGQPCEPPKPGELPELPAAWVQGLAEGATDAGLAAADRGDGEILLAQLVADERPMCKDIASAAQQAVEELKKADAGSRHDTAIARVHHLIQLSAAGHHGLGVKLPEIAALWDELTAGEDRADEWERMLLTSARKAVTAVGLRQVANDPCIGFTGVVIAAGPAPGNDTGNEDAPEPIMPRVELNPREVIGTHLFDPQAGLDQTLAEAVLERMQPAVRYAYDTGIWLRRGRVVWETSNNLAEWCVAQLAGLMPIGDPEADKNTGPRLQADRRARFMTAGKAAAIGKKMEALLAGGAHPSAVRIVDLDTEPWLLWAGGVGWDLTASADGPVRAFIDPGTPHLQAAGVAPEVRPTPLWDAFIEAVWPDPELRAWALRVLSVAVTGYADKSLPVLLGDANRGKTQVVSLIMSVLGNYAHAADPKLLISTDNAHGSIIYALKGRRLSFIDEAPRDTKTGQERLKQLTGGGELTGNLMHKNPITFQPSHTLILTANNEPLLTDPAVRSRIRLIQCLGDPEQVIATRAAIGHTSGPAWRREAPGVLAKLMAEAARWLADRESASTLAAPEAYRFKAEEIAAAQNYTARWVKEETEPDDKGTRSSDLRAAYVHWCQNLGLERHQIPSETKWGTDLNALGVGNVHKNNGQHRLLRLTFGGLPGFTVTRTNESEGLPPESEGLVRGSNDNPSPQKSQQNPRVADLENANSEGLRGTNSIYTHAHARTHAHAQTETTPHPLNPSLSANPSPAAQPELTTAEPLPSVTKPAKAKRETKATLTPEQRAAAKAEASAAKRAEAISAAAGELVQLPALVTRDGSVTPVDLAELPAAFHAFGVFDRMTVDVEHTGYPIGHADYALRTVQLGNDKLAVVFDAADAAQLEMAAYLLSRAAVLHAHSATADLIPLDAAGVLDAEAGWDRMHDTVIPALLADPQSTGSDAAGLKALARDVLGEHATSPAADDARDALFKAGRWLKDTEATTPIERSGWAQVDPRCTTMVRYAASDVLDTAALATVLPVIPADLLDRERTAQRMTARVARIGVRLDRERVDLVRKANQQGRADAAERVRAFGIDNPGSNPQVAAKLAELGATLPRTKMGALSVAKGVIEAFRNDAGPVGDCTRAVLDYRHHDTALGLLLDPYHQLVTRGDGRARPTVYTLGAATGRMSCVRPNLQQVSRQGGIRACLTADPGMVIVSADFASVEVRVAAALSQDPAMLAMLAEGVDLHWQIARQAYGPDATKEDRYNTKRAVFGRLYGSGIAGIARTLGKPETEAAAIVASLDALTPQLAAWTAALKRAVGGGMRHFETYSGRIVHLDPKLPHKALNYCVQGTARELLVDTLVKWRETRWGECVLMPVHDELLVFVPEADAQEATAALVASMESTLMGVAIKAEASEPSFEWKDAS